jgi:transposase
VSKDEQITQLKIEKTELKVENSHLQDDKAQLEFELAQLKKYIFGTKSEKFNSSEVDPEQLNLFNTPEDIQEEEVVEVVEVLTYERKKGNTHKGRNKLPDHLPVTEIIIEPEVDTTDMVKIGEEVSETLDYTPASLMIIRRIRPKYVDKKASEEDSGSPIFIAPMPMRALNKCIAEPALLAYIIVSKFVDHLPFYRQIQMFKRDFKWKPPKSTVNDWFIAVCTLLEPLYEALIVAMLQSNYLHGDESPIKVQDKSKKGKTHLGYQWVYLSPLVKLVLFQYHRSRSMQAPKELLSNYKGYLQTDGYAVYDKLERTIPDIRLVDCWVHARRKFHEALDNDSKRSKHVLSIFSEMYKHEDVCREKKYSAEKRKLYRNKHLKPLLDKLKEWIEEECIKVTPKSPIGKAMSYTQNQWPKLKRVLEDGRLELDNNPVENKIRPLALGRKNYLFAGSHPAAQRIAMMYSFFASCKLNDVNPREWLTYVLENVNDTKITEIHKLLPNNFNTENL